MKRILSLFSLLLIAAVQMWAEEPEKPIAQIGETVYTNVDNFLFAFNTINGTATVKLLDDIELPYERYMGEMYQQYDITLDLNGHNLKGDYSYGSMIYEDNASLVIEGEGAVENVGYYGSVVGGSGTVVINGGAFKCERYIFDFYEGSEMIINGGKFNGPLYDSNKAKPTVAGGLFLKNPLECVAEGYMVVWNGASETKEEYPYKVASSESAEEPAIIKPLTVGDNDVVINNPTTGAEWTYARKSPLNYTLFSYTALVDAEVTVYANGELDTYGALFDKDYNCLQHSDKWDESIYGIKFIVKAGELYYIGARGCDNITVGSYTLTVEENTQPEAAIGDRFYYALASAINDLKDGETLTLTADVEKPNGADNEFYNYVTATLDLNGHTLYGSFFNHGSLTIEDSSDDKTGKIIAGPDDYVLVNNSSYNSITINGGTFVGGQIISDMGVFYLNGGTFILPSDSDFGYTMCQYDNIVFGDNIVYRDLGGEHEDISEVTEFIMYSGKFVEAGTETGVGSINADKAQKAIKTIENGRIVIIRDGDKWDLSGRKL